MLFVLYLEPAFRRSSFARQIDPFRDNAFKTQFAGVLENHRALACHGRRRWHRHHHHGCRVVVKRFDHGRRVVKRTRICR